MSKPRLNEHGEPDRPQRREQRKWPGGTDMDSTDATWWTELRAEFPYLENHVFAWSGGQAPVATSVQAAIDRVMAAWDADTLSRLSQREWAVFDGTRQEVAVLFGCPPEQVAVSEHVTRHVPSRRRWCWPAGSGRVRARPAWSCTWDCHPASSYQWLVAGQRHPSLTVRWASRGDHEDPVEALLANADEETIAVVRRTWPGEAAPHRPGCPGQPPPGCELGTAGRRRPVGERRAARRTRATSTSSDSPATSGCWGRPASATW